MSEDVMVFLFNASDVSLGDFELSRFQHAANLRKEIGALLEHAIEEEALARFAQLVRERRKQLAAIADLAQELADEEGDPFRHRHAMHRVKNGSVRDAAAD
jgi:hypothetical protein